RRVRALRSPPLARHRAALGPARHQSRQGRLLQARRRLSPRQPSRVHPPPRVHPLPLLPPFLQAARSWPAARPLLQERRRALVHVPLLAPRPRPPRPPRRRLLVPPSPHTGVLVLRPVRFGKLPSTLKV